MLNSDLQVTNVTGNGFDWQVVDLGSKIPATTRIVYVKVYVSATQANTWCSVRPYGSSSAPGIETHTAVANVFSVAASMVGVNSSKIEFKCLTPPGSTINAAGIALWGYYEPGY